MKLNKRSADASPAPHTAETGGTPRKRSHILIYILILFIAAFLLMTLSFLSNKRSNEQILGQLHSNASSLQKLQTALEENLHLQEQISAQNSRLEELENQLTASQSDRELLREQLSSLEKTSEQQQKERDTLQQTISAMDALVTLQQLYISEDPAACRNAIASIEAAGLDRLLPTTAAAPGSVSPYQMFQHVKLLTAIPSAEG